MTLAGPSHARTGKEMSDLAIIEDGAVLIDGDSIVAAGRTDELEGKITGISTVIDRGEEASIGLPGFVDSHTHPIFAATREEEYERRTRGATYQEIAAHGGGIRSSVRKVRQATNDFLYRNAFRYCQQFLTHGTTTIEAKSGYGLSVNDELRILEVIRGLNETLDLDLVPTFLGGHDVPDEFREDRRAYISLIIDAMLPRISREKLAVFCDVFCDRGFFSIEESRTILNAAKKNGFQLKIHADELSRSGGAELASELGALSADHLEQVSERGIAMMREFGVIATLLPGTAFNLGLKTYPPARRLIDSGVPVALATDFNPGTCFTPNMQLILSIACAQMKMTPAEAVTAATVNGAYALGLGHRIGSIEPGKQADMVLLDLSDYRQLPYYFGVNHCKTVVKKGKIIDVRK